MCGKTVYTKYKRIMKALKKTEKMLQEKAERVVEEEIIEQLLQRIADKSCSLMEEVTDVLDPKDPSDAVKVFLLIRKRLIEETIEQLVESLEENNPDNSKKTV